MFGLFKGKKPAAKAGEEKKKKATSKKKTTSKKKASPKKTTAPKVPAGLETRTQIKQFQLANGLLPTGLLDEATLEKAKK
jgi:hemolysin activation/secretion protein